MRQIHSTAQARQILDNPNETVAEREAAIYFLGADPTTANLERLVEALEDNDFGVRWAAGATLARAGDAALPPLARALVRKHDSVWLREGAYHALYYNASGHVSALTVELQKALKGPAAEVATVSAAEHLLIALDRAGETA